MLTGRFGDTTRRPYIEGRLIFPRLNIRANISFCVDTGADRSLLLPSDGVRLGLDYAALSGNQESVGVGGLCRNFTEQAALVFTDPGRYLYVYVLSLAIRPPGADIMDLPSLLGRDILNQWRMRYDASKNLLAFTVISADAKVRIPRADG